VSRFAFQTDVQGRGAVVTLRGELDLLATGELEPELDRLARETSIEVVALDLRGLEFLDSSGLRMILVFRNRLSHDDRRLALVRGPRAVQRVFDITRTTERLEFVDAPEHVLGAS
jgi:anti-sigma B factor antagonist